MDFNKIEEINEIINQNGHCLTPNERIQINNNINILKEKYNNYDILFWGKIIGINDNYYIITIVNYNEEFEFPSKTFFYSTSDFIFKHLEGINTKFKDILENYNDKFIGDPLHILNKEENDELNEDDINNNKDYITELIRLSYVIRAIDYDCQFTYRYNYKILNNFIIQKNKNIANNEFDDVIKIENWVHFRKNNNIDLKEYVFNNQNISKFYFLETLVDNYNIAITNDVLKENVSIKNLYWPGSVSFHILTNNIFGFFYIGDGIKNVNLRFLIN